MKTKKQKITLVVIMVAVLILVVLKRPTKRANPFASCQVLADSCMDESCSYLFLCNETEFSDCRVYDCGEKYGVRILDKQGNARDKFRQKPDQAKVQEMISKCRGSFEAIEKNNCENGEARAKIKVNTQSDCKISGATMAINGKTRIASVERDGEFYNISVKSCGEISDIKITGEGGVAISEKVEIEDIPPMKIPEIPMEVPEEYTSPSM